VTSFEVATYLSDRLAQLSLKHPAKILERLMVYFRLLSRWNRTVNLAGFDLNRPTQAAVDRLLLEPLVAAACVAEVTPRIVDVGSGGGSPAIPMAIALDSRALTLVEARLKKSLFLKEALRAVGIDRGEVITGRHTDLGLRTDEFDILTSRAVRLDMAAIRGFSKLVRVGGRIYLLRGHDVGILTLPQSLIHVETRRLAGLQNASLVILERK
jgi:16S rRNA (guanine527-N7)-methyltransferase